MSEKEIVVDTLGLEDGTDVHVNRPQNAEVQVDVLPEVKQ